MRAMVPSPRAVASSKMRAERGKVAELPPPLYIHLACERHGDGCSGGHVARERIERLGCSLHETGDHYVRRCGVGLEFKFEGSTWT
jgi:hypothetical protein